jgi:hypothetical protein
MGGAWMNAKMNGLARQVIEIRLAICPTPRELDRQARWFTT